jgi:hypothetical protein
MSAPQLFSCDDGVLRVLKLQGLCPPTVLAQDWLGCVLAVSLGIPTPKPALVHIDDAAVRSLPQQLSGRAQTGIALGTEYSEKASAILRMPSLTVCENHVDLLSTIFVLDSWLGTADRMQPDFGRNLLIDAHDDEDPRLMVIDFGLTFPGALIPLLGPPPEVEGVVHADVIPILDADIVRRTLNQIMEMPEATLYELAASAPNEWVGEDGKVRLANFVIRRRPLLRQAIESKISAPL